MVPIDKLQFHPTNVKKHDSKQLHDLGVLYEMIGFTDPIIADKNNLVWAGNGSLEEALAKGMKEVPVVYMPETWTEEQKKVFMLMDNKINESEYNIENVQIILEDVDPILFDDFEMNIEDFNIKTLEETSDVPPLPEEVKSKLGEIYKLGNHRIMCGDSFNDIPKLMDKKGVVVLTDPPYGMHLDTDFTEMKGIAGGNKYKPVANDDKDYNPEHIFRDLGYCKEIFLFGADYYAERIPLRNEGSWVVWDKTDGGHGPNSDYDKMFGSNFELCWSKNKHKRALARVLWKGIFGLQKEDTRKRLHPTHKPTELARWFIEKFSKKEDIIVDIFLGSGSTLIACEQTDRVCYGMELDPGYVDVIIQRWENYTGKKAVLAKNSNEELAN